MCLKTKKKFGGRECTKLIKHRKREKIIQQETGKMETDKWNTE